MEQQLSIFFQALFSYIHRAELTSVNFWLYPITSLFAIWVLVLILTKFLRRSLPLLSLWYVYQAAVIASQITAALILSISLYLWTQHYYDNEPNQLAYLLAWAVSLLVPFLLMVALRNYYHRDRVKDIVLQPKTRLQAEQRFQFLIQKYKILRLWYFLPLLGLVSLFFLSYRETNLVSVVLDNSDSMKGTNLDNGKAALTQTFLKLQDNTHIIFTVLDNQKKMNKKGETVTFSSFLQLISSTNLSDLRGISQFFATPKDAIAYLDGIAICEDSPISEGVWHNFLFAEQKAKETAYKNKTLLIITDGKDNIGGLIEKSTFFCGTKNFEDFFPSTNVHIIDISGEIAEGRSNVFFQKSQGCGYEIHNGSTADDYESALNETLSAYGRDYYFIAWLFFIYVLVLGSSLLIEPRKIYR